MKMRVRALAAAVVVLVLQGALGAHDIPDEIVLQSYVRPEQNRLQVLLRIPLLAVADANLPKDGPGYLAMQYLDPALGEAANQISNGIVFLEEDERLTGYELMHARISLPSDRSFDTYERALAHVRGPKLPDSTQVFYNQGFLDLELSFPIQSEASAFAMRVLFGRGMANRTATIINFIRPDGAVRAFRIHDDTPLVRLDPKAHQAAWVFLSAGFYRFLDGLDHLLFIVALAIPFRRARELIKPVAAFAVAHSVALFVMAMVGTPTSTWFVAVIGALVALSLVYVALENSVGTTRRYRWIVALVFGLFHGAGFAIALQDTLQFAGSHPIAALVSYNLGLEFGDDYRARHHPSGAEPGVHRRPRTSRHHRVFRARWPRGLALDDGAFCARTAQRVAGLRRQPDADRRAVAACADSHRRSALVCRRSHETEAGRGRTGEVDCG